MPVRGRVAPRRLARIPDALLERKKASGRLGWLLAWAVVFADIGTSIYYVPGLLKHFQAHEINALIVPRPRLSLNGRKDLLTPPTGVDRIRAHLLPLYAKAGRDHDCRIELFDCGHEEIPQMRALVSEWLGKYLCGEA